MQNIVLKQTTTPNDPTAYCDALARFSGLPKSQTKKATSCGAAWIAHSGKKMRRIRRAKTIVRPGVVIALYCDETILAVSPPQAQCFKDLIHHSIWFKSVDLINQGSRHEDHCALLRQAEMIFKSKRRVLPVHRLDREAAGLIMAAHHHRSAAALPEMFREASINKRYRTRMRGDLSQHRGDDDISLALSGHPALTHDELIACDAVKNLSLVQIQIITGRRHQIRHHFDLIGHPVMGGPRCGLNNQNKAGLQLTAYGLAFTCPFGNGLIDMAINPDTTP